MRLKFQHIVVFVLFCAGVLASLLREMLFANYYGISQNLEIFRIAYSLPNLFSLSVGTAFISVAVPYLVKNDDNSNSKISTLFLLNILIVLAITIFALLFSPYLSQLLAPGFSVEMHERLVVASRICWLMFLMIGLSWFVRAYINTRGIFWIGASVNLIKSGMYVVYFILIYFSIKSLSKAGYELEFLAALSGILIFFAHITPLLLGHGTNLKNRVAIRFISINEFKILLVALCSVLAYQVLSIVPVFQDRAYASYMAPGVIASIEYSYAIIIAAGSVLSSVFTMLMLPSFSRKAQNAKDFESIKTHFILSSMVIAVAIIIGVMLCVFAKDIVKIFLVRGEFTLQSSVITSDNLFWMAIGFPAMVCNVFLVQAIIVFNKMKYLVGVGLIKILFKYGLLIYCLNLFNTAVFGFTFFIIEYICTVILAGLTCFSFKKQTKKNCSAMLITA